MYTCVWLSFVLVAAILMKIRLLWKRKGSRKSKFLDTLPYFKWTPISLPLIDGLINVIRLKRDGIRFGLEVSKRMGANVSVYRLSTPFFDLVAVEDPDILQKLLRSKIHGHLPKHKFFSSLLLKDFLQYGLLTSDIGIWSSHRQVLSKAFSYKSLQHFLRYFTKESSEISNKVLEKLCSCPTINNQVMKSILNYHVFKITAQVILCSEDFSLSDKERFQFFEAFNQWKEILIYRVFHPQWLLPYFWKFHPNKSRLDQAINQINLISTRVKENYRMKRKSEVELQQEVENSIPSNHIKQQQGSNCKAICLVETMVNAGLSSQEIGHEINTFLAAGHETLLATLDMLLFHLALNKEHQHKCQAEVDALFELKTKNLGHQNFTMEDLSQLKYLERCILESLRLTPTIPGFVRQMEEPFEIDAERELEAGTVVIISPWVIHRNPKIYPNPNMFDPDRFLPENVRCRPSSSFLPFSYGPRNCIGWKLAIMEMKVIMAHILRSVDMSTTDKFETVKFKFDITAKPEKTFNILYNKRNHETTY